MLVTVARITPLPMIDPPIFGFTFAISLLLAASAAAGPGDYDTTFGDGGGSTVSFTSGNDYAYSVAIEPGGKILLAGGSSAGDFSVLRLLANGNPDPAFGTAGKSIHKFGLFELARGVSPLTGGKILVCGAGLVSGGSRDFAIMRLSADGSLDSTFGTGGITTTDLQGGFNESVTCMTVDANGSATVAGASRGKFALVRYTPAGALDPSFGSGGKVFTTSSSAGEESVNAIATQGDGKIVVAGQSTANGNPDMVVARYLPNGTPDPSFGTGGKAVLQLFDDTLPDAANGLTVLPDGKILIAGTSDDSYAVVRLTATGALDPSFGTDGSTIIGYDDSIDAGNALALQTDGKILVAGTSTIDGRDYFGLLRFTAAGKLDRSFGGGALLTLITDGSDTGRALAVQQDGRIVVAGDGGSLGARDFGVVRYESAGVVSLGRWRENHFGTSANTGVAADLSDADGDGLANILEYAFGLDPLDASSLALPQWQVRDGGLMTEYNTSASVTGITYTAEWSPSMAPGSWKPITDAGIAGSHRFILPVSDNPKRFVRSGIRSQ